MNELLRETRTRHSVTECVAVKLLKITSTRNVKIDTYTKLINTHTNTTQTHKMMPKIFLPNLIDFCRNNISKQAKKTLVGKKQNNKHIFIYCKFLLTKHINDSEFPFVLCFYLQWNESIFFECSFLLLLILFDAHLQFFPIAFVTFGRNIIQLIECVVEKCEYASYVSFKTYNIMFNQFVKFSSFEKFVSIEMWLSRICCRAILSKL